MHRSNSLWMVASSNAPLHAILLVLCFLNTVGAAPTQNITIDVPLGTTNHGDPNLLCLPPTGIDLTKFYVLNYFAHALTVVSYPGESKVDVIITLIAATLYPTSGAMRGIGAILRHSVFKSSDLQKAARSGALYMVVRSPRWKPQMVRMTDKYVSGEEIVAAGGKNVQLDEENLNNAEEDIVEEDIVERNQNLKDVAEKGPGVLASEKGVTGVIRDILVGENAESTRKSKVSPTTRRDLVETPTDSPGPQRRQAVRFSTYVPSWMRESSYIYWSYPDTGDEAASRDLFGPKGQQLPDEYDFAFVPRNATVEELEPTTPIKLSYSYSWINGAAALLQALYAIFTLYDSRGNQIDQYGFAAFGLTVVPYAVMSVLNLFANIVTPSYSTLYLVESEVMKEAERRKGSRFSNVVGRLKSFEDSSETNDTHGYVVGRLTDGDVLCLPSVSPPSRKQNEDFQILTMEPNTGLSVQVPTCPRFHRTDRVHELKPHEQRLGERFNLLDHLLFLVVCGIELAVIGGLSRFRKRGSTRAQEIWTMSWFTVGCLLGFLIHNPRLIVRHGGPETMRQQTDEIRSSKVVWILMSSVPSVGGFVIVGQMIKVYGSCLRL